MDVFEGHKTVPMLQVLKDNNILIEYVPSNMTNYYQLFDLLPIRGPNNTMKISWYSDQTRKEFNKGTSIEDIKVKFPRS